jgi:hypothetical protein
LRRHLTAGYDFLSRDVSFCFRIDDHFVTVLGKPIEKPGEDLRDFRALGPR